jgi:hypothetical protein
MSTHRDGKTRQDHDDHDSDTIHQHARDATAPLAAHHSLWGIHPQKRSGSLPETDRPGGVAAHPENLPEALPAVCGTPCTSMISCGPISSATSSSPRTPVCADSRIISTRARSGRPTGEHSWIRTRSRQAGPVRITPSRHQAIMAWRHVIAGPVPTPS